jgi:hypothetical protein
MNGRRREPCENARKPDGATGGATHLKLTGRSTAVARETVDAIAPPLLDPQIE